MGVIVSCYDVMCWCASGSYGYTNMKPSDWQQLCVAEPMVVKSWVQLIKEQVAEKKTEAH